MHPRHAPLLPAATAAHPARAWRRLARAAACWLAVVGGMASANVQAQAQARAPAEAQAPTPAAPAAADTAAAPAEPMFDVLEFEIEGNTVLTVTTVEQTVTPFLGPQRGMAAVEAARAALDQAYQRAGYLSVVVDVPEQRVDGGVVRLRVLEGRVEHLRVTGAQYFSQGWIRANVPALTPGTVPDFNAVQRQLAALNRTDDRRVQPVLRPGRSPGTLDAELKVEDRLPLGASVELNNRHARDTVPWRLSGTVRYDNLFQREHSLSVTATVAPEDIQQARVLALNYSVPMADGGAWLGYLVASDSLVEPLGASVIGKGTTLGLRRVLPLPLSGALQQGLTLGLDFKDIQQHTTAAGDTIASPLRYLPMSIDWTGSLQDAGSSTQLTVAMSVALRSILQRTVDCAGVPTDQFECSRRNADGSFAVLRGELRRQWKLDAQGWSLLGRLAVQQASGPLSSGEQYALGGAETVRGYLESETSADQAYLGAVELRSPNLAGRLAAAFGQGPGEGLGAARTARLGITEAVASAYLDAARGELIDPALGQRAVVKLAGAGLGLRLRLGERAEGAFDLAWPLRLTDTVRAHDPRLHARLVLRF
jgi:hemolysin activation/secretion protein